MLTIQVRSGSTGDVVNQYNHPHCGVVGDYTGFTTNLTNAPHDIRRDKTASWLSTVNIKEKTTESRLQTDHGIPSCFCLIVSLVRI